MKVFVNFIKIKMSKINFKMVKKKSIFVLAMVVLLLFGIFGIYAVLTPGSKPDPGHLLSQVSPPSDCGTGALLGFSYSSPPLNTPWKCFNCSNNAILKTTSEGTSLNYINISDLVSSLWTEDANGLTYSGYVGIGTASSPSYRLSVNGTTYINGEIKIGAPPLSCASATAGLLIYNSGSGKLQICMKIDETNYNWIEIPVSDDVCNAPEYTSDNIL